MYPEVARKIDQLESETTWGLQESQRAPHCIDKYRFIHRISGMSTERDRVHQLFECRPLLRSRELEASGIGRKTIKRMTDAGEILKVAPGLYCSPDYIPGTHYSLIEAQKIVKRGVVCLLSALSYHEIGTQNPSLVWIAIPNRSWRPNTGEAPVNIVTFSGKAFTEGVVVHTVDNEKVRIYSIPKTIADCFKYRNKIGLEVAIEALKDVLQNKRATVDELLHFGNICRVRSVMTPYMESLV